MTSLVALAESTTAVPGFPRLSSRLSPFLTAAMLRYMPYAKGPHHRPTTGRQQQRPRAPPGSRLAGRGWQGCRFPAAGRPGTSPRRRSSRGEISFARSRRAAFLAAVDGSSADGMGSGWVARPAGLDAGGELMGDHLGPPPK